MLAIATWITMQLAFLWYVAFFLPCISSLKMLKNENFSWKSSNTASREYSFFLVYAWSSRTLQLRHLVSFWIIYPFGFFCTHTHTHTHYIYILYICDFVNVSSTDGIDWSLTVIFVLLYFRRAVRHVGNSQVSDDAAGFVRYFFYYLVFFFENVRNTDLQVVNNYTPPVWTENNI
jgi:hypothetical protein